MINLTLHYYIKNELKQLILSKSLLDLSNYLENL